MSNRKHRAISTIAMAGATLLILVAVLMLVSIARPMYLLYGSSVVTEDRSRILIADGVLMIEKVNCRGSLAFKPGENRFIRAILKSQHYPQPFTNSPETDKFAAERAQQTVGSIWITSPMIFLNGPTRRNYGGYERASAFISIGKGSMSVQVFCVPLWFICAIIGGGLAVVWLARRVQRRLILEPIGFPVARVERSIAPRPHRRDFGGLMYSLGQKMAARWRFMRAV